MEKDTVNNLRNQIFSVDETDGEKHMRLFCEAVRANTQPPIETIQFLADAFTVILKMNPRKADSIKKILQLSGNSGRPRAEDEYIEHATEVERIIERNNIGEDKARMIVAENMKRSYKTIRRHHIEFKETAKLNLSFEKWTDAIIVKKLNKRK